MSSHPAPTVAIAFPADLNWFYARLARVLERELQDLGHEARAIPARALEPSPQPSGSCVLVINPTECATCAERAGRRMSFLSALPTFERRVLVNYDSLHTHWFHEQLKLGRNLFTDLFDIGVISQARGTYAGLRYSWIPEAVWLQPRSGGPQGWTSDRPFPWAVIGHANASRAALVSALAQTSRPNGFVYLPPLRPYDGRSGLDETRLHAVLEKTDLYVWNSHHLHPYHEGLRAIQAIAAGAVPAKIDPLHAQELAGIPWVYPSLRAMAAAREAEGPAGLYAAARAFLAGFPPLGASVAAALSRPA